MSDKIIINLKNLNDYQRGFIDATLNAMQGNRPSPEMENDRVNIAWNQGIAKGKAEEREAIVAWLSGPLNSRYLAELIENGEHLGDDDE